MKRIVIALLAGGIAGAAAGFAGGIFVYPFWFLNDVAHEALAENGTRTRIATGSFVHVNPSDPVHWGRGTAAVYREGDGRTVVHLEDDFEVGPGPRFHVYLADRATIDSAAAFRASETVDLGRLRAFKGSQIYPVPPGVDSASFSSVVIWCKEFGVLISPAALSQGTRPTRGPGRAAAEPGR